MKAASIRQRRISHRRQTPIEDRAFYTRREFSIRFGIGDKYLNWLIEHDDTVPMILVGRNQLFPKAASETWFEMQATKRRNLYAAVKKDTEVD